MFHMADYALSPTEIEMLQEQAHIDADGLIAYPHEESGRRAVFNGCDLIMLWQLPDTFGMQRIRIGAKVAITRAQWRRRLRRRIRGRSYLNVIAEHRADKIRKVFCDEAPRFSIVGFRLLNIAFWNPKTALRIKAAKEPRVEQVRTRAARYLFAPVAQKPNASHH